MAAFNQEVGVNQQNYLGYSKGSDPDRSMEILFKGAAGLAEGGIKAVDEGIQGNIREDITAEKDAVDDAFGVTSGAAVGASKTGPQSPLPGEIEDAKGYLGQMANAFASGELRESHYWGRLEQKVKGLRAKYPGYREQIDNIVADVTGATPANALRTQLISEIESDNRLKAESTNKIEQWVKENEQYLSPGDAVRFFEGDRTSEFLTNMRLDVQAKKSRDYQIQTENTRLAAMEAEDKRDTEAAGEMLAGRAFDISTKGIEAALGVLGNKSVLQFAEEAHKSGGVDDAERDQIATAFRELKNQMWAQFDQEAGAKLSPESDATFMTILGGDVDKHKKIIEDRLKHIETALTDGNAGILMQTANSVKAMQDTTARQLLQNYEIRVATSLTNLGLKETASIAILDRTKHLGSVLATVTSILGTGVATGDIPSTEQAIREYQQAGHKDPDGIKAIIDIPMDILMNPSTTAEQADKLVEGIFGDANTGLIGKATRGDQITLLNKLTGPAVTSRMAELGQQNPALVDKYQTFVLKQFHTIFRPQAKDIDALFEANKTADGVTAAIVLDQDRFQLELDDSFDPAGSSDPVTAMQAFEDRKAFVEAGLKELNGYLRILKPALDLNDRNAEKELGDLLGTMGIEFEAEDADTGAEGNDQSAVDDDIDGIQFASLILEPEEEGADEHQFERFAARVEASDLPKEDVKVLDMLGQAEGADYETFSGGSKINLTGKTVKEVLATQKNWSQVQGAISSASGKYQIIQKTLAGLVRQGVLDPDELFDEEAQDRAAMALLNNRGYARYKAGKMSKTAFLNNLAKEWASVPNTSGRSAYAGDGVNNATRAGRAIAEMITGG